MTYYHYNDVRKIRRSLNMTQKQLAEIIYAQLPEDFRRTISASSFAYDISVLENTASSIQESRRLCAWLLIRDYAKRLQETPDPTPSRDAEAPQEVIPEVVPEASPSLMDAYDAVILDMYAQGKIVRATRGATTKTGFGLIPFSMTGKPLRDYQQGEVFLALVSQVFMSPEIRKLTQDFNVSIETLLKQLADTGRMISAPQTSWGYRNVGRSSSWRIMRFPLNVFATDTDSVDSDVIQTSLFNTAETAPDVSPETQDVPRAGIPLAQAVAFLAGWNKKNSDLDSAT